MSTPPVVPRQDWEAAHERLLVKEEELARARRELAAERCRLPWLAVGGEYVFDGPRGSVRLVDLFEGRRQLLLYRAFLEPGVLGWPDHVGVGCSMMADQVAGIAHLNARNTTLAYVSRAPQPEIQQVKARMGWTMPWYTILDEFDADFGVDQGHGTNAFIRDDEAVYRTYFVNARGYEALGSVWSYLDITALGTRRLGRTHQPAVRRPRRSSVAGGVGGLTRILHLGDVAPRVGA